MAGRQNWNRGIVLQVPRLVCVGHDFSHGWIPSALRKEGNNRVENRSRLLEVGEVSAITEHDKA